LEFLKVPNNLSQISYKLLAYDSKASSHILLESMADLGEKSVRQVKIREEKEKKREKEKGCVLTVYTIVYNVIQA